MVIGNPEPISLNDKDLKIRGDKFIVYKNERVGVEPSKDGRSYHEIMGQVAYEKVLRLLYWNGEQTKEIIIRNLAQKVGNATKEDFVLTTATAITDGNILFKEEKLVIKRKNILSIEPALIKIKGLDK